MNATTVEPCGVRMPAGHWSDLAVHSFRRWASYLVIETWCGLTADLKGGANLTTALISCSACAQASLTDFKR